MIEQSLTGRVWRWRDTEDRIAAAIAQRLQLPDMMGRLLAARQLMPDTARDYLQPTLRGSLPDPSIFCDMDIAVDRLARAVQTGETVGIFGDYDVDGACSTALLTELLHELGCPTRWHVPDRIKEGYGPNSTALLNLAADGATLVVCVDCGTAAGETLACLQGHADVVVVDHHRSETVPHTAVATVNPNRLDCPSGLHGLCAAAMVFMTSVGLIRALRRSGFFANRPEPDLLAKLDLVALATVCDVMPLTGLNRAFVVQGLKIMGRQQRPGIVALMEVAQSQGRPSAFTCGYILGPRINAGGRIDDAGLGLKLLLTRDPAEAKALATRLNTVNQDRRDIEAATMDDALRQADAQMERGHAVLLVHGEDWHPGIVGIIAGRLKEKHHRPVCAAGGDALLKGSGRSIPGLDLGGAITAAKTAGLLHSGGGHPMAAGFAVHRHALDDLHAFLNEKLTPSSPLPVAPELILDAGLTIPAATEQLAEQLAQLAPFGAGNAEPVLMLPRARILRADRIGRDGTTIRAWIEGEGGGPRLKAIIFRAGEGPLADALMARSGPMHLAGHLRVEEWNGNKSTSFCMIDAAVA